MAAHETRGQTWPEFRVARLRLQAARLALDYGWPTSKVAGSSARMNRRVGDSQSDFPFVEITSRQPAATRLWHRRHRI